MNSVGGSASVKLCCHQTDYHLNYGDDDNYLTFDTQTVNGNDDDMDIDAVAAAADIDIVTCHRDALLKMQDVYRQNSALGDPASLDPQLEENAQKLDQLQKEVAKFQAC